jgi:hypothetical protein
MKSNHTNQEPVSFNGAAIVLAWLFPGVGHISIGQKRRGLLIMSGMLFLVLCGVLVGGIDAVDHKNDGLWFIAQVWCGPIVIAVDLLNQALIAPLPVDEKATLVGLSHVNEMGTLFIAMAGLMNFVIILDVIQAKKGDDFELRSGSKERRAQQ